MELKELEIFAGVGNGDGGCPFGDRGPNDCDDNDDDDDDNELLQD